MGDWLVLVGTVFQTQTARQFVRFSLKKEMELDKNPKGIAVRLPETGCANDCVQLVNVGPEFMREIGNENMAMGSSSKSKGKGKGNNSFFWREPG